MTKNTESKSIEQILAEAEELIQQINSDILDGMEEEHRLQFELHAQNLKNLKSEIQQKIDNKAASDIGSGAEGIHEAIEDIVKALGAYLKK